ncbi:MAG: acyl-CoA dehydrogenase [candidate division Zixibacteria bacterium SM23_73_2]|nr:MAG: acyl-CoA dehydrogenase [candidate division Zixibacteria bacterium SM23_73_2]
MIIEEKHQSFRNKIRDFAEEHIQPLAKEIDEQQRFPHDSFKKLGQMGIMGMVVPPDYGGTGDDMITYAIAVEELSRVCGSTGITVAAHNSLAVYPLYLFGNEKQKKKYIPPLAKGEKLGAFGLTETGAGSDAGATKTTAELKGDFYLINGNKCFITNASVADTLVITARTDPGKGSKGISNFILEKGMPGLSVGKKENKMGLRGSDTAELVFENVKVPRENLLGNEGEGFKQFLITLDGGRVSIGAMALGIAQGAYEKATEYAKERIQFEKPIGYFQAIQWKLADMATKIEAARHLIYHAAWLKDQNKPYIKESAMAKLYASEVGSWVCHQAIQIFGGYGYLREYPLERYLRDIKLCEIGEGTSEIQRIVIARDILK